MSVSRITKEELKERMDKGEDAILLDVRAPDSYNGSNIKIKGSQRKDPLAVGSWYKEVPQDKLTVTYCT